MRTFLHPSVAEALRRCEKETRGGKPQWCFEVQGIEADRGVSALINELDGWGRDVLFATFEVGEKFRTAAVDMQELRRIIVDSVASGRVVAVLDGCALGGCKFDFSDEGARVFELLVTCWGSRESTVDRLLEQFPQGRTFRGN